MIVDIDILPVSLWHLVDFVHDANVGMLLVRLVPPVPPFAMGFGVSEGVEAFVGAEVEDSHDLV
jgi:hypothetical protein